MVICARNVQSVMARGASFEKKIGKSWIVCSRLGSYSSFRCKKCKGEKTVNEKTRQEIYIEKGMPDGYRIVLAGAGDQEVSLFHNNRDAYLET